MIIPLFLTALVRLGPIEDTAPAPINIFPKPSSVEQRPGEFRFDRDTIIEAPQDCANEAHFLADILKKGAGDPAITQSAGRSQDTVVFELDDSMEDLGPEGYTLTVTPKSVIVMATKPAGIFYGIQTIRQLLPAGIEDPGMARHVRWSIPCVQIKDKPKFAWRGMMLDVSRHFFPKKDVEHILDLLALQKLNVFHWHLADDGGWRIEIKKYPKLTDFGAWRQWTSYLWDQGKLSFPGTSSGARVYGGFYTQDDIREIVKYAADRHIMVVPEIEMPGHSLAACLSYPEVTCTDADVKGYGQTSGEPMPNVYCAGKEATFTFLEGVLDEVCDLFPSPYVHIGGDEVDKTLWQHCTDCQKRMKDEGLKTPEELQSYFVRRIEKYLNSKGKRLIGWDEILEGGLAPNAAVMSWRGIQGGIDAAKAGHTVVMSPTSACYFDYTYNDISTQKVFDYDPIPPDLSGDQKNLVIGAQCNLWTERVPDVATAEQRMFPRILALSEDVWSENKDTDYASFEARLTPFYARLDALNLNYHVEAPVADYGAVILNGSGKVSFQAPSVTNALIRYTTDGSVPDANSPLYQSPITVSKACTITAALFHRQARSELTRVDVRENAAPDEAQLAPGLSWQLYDGQFSSDPGYDDSGLFNSPHTVAAKGVDSAIGLEGGKTENYALAFNGFIRIEQDGVYTFSTTSDDGSTLSIAGAKVVDNDGLHAVQEKSGRVFLKRGFYPIRIGYFQAGSAQALSVAMEGPGITKGPIDPKLLFHKE